MGDERMNKLLRWGIENSPDGLEMPAEDEKPKSNLTPELIEAIMGGPSEADLMKASMEIITSPDEEVSLENKLIAFDNFEQLIESLDNANNMHNLKLWEPLLQQLQHKEADIRKMSAWCVGTAVQNNEKTQECLHAAGGVKPIVELAVAEAESEAVRRKAIYALSSAIRNYQPALDSAVEELATKGHAYEKVDAQDMDAVDTIINGLRNKAKGAAV